MKGHDETGREQRRCPITTATSNVVTHRQEKSHYTEPVPERWESGPHTDTQPLGPGQWSPENGQGWEPVGLRVRRPQRLRGM